MRVRVLSTGVTQFVHAALVPCETRCRQLCKNISHNLQINFAIIRGTRNLQTLYGPKIVQHLNAKKKNAKIINQKKFTTIYNNVRVSLITCALYHGWFKTERSVSPPSPPLHGGVGDIRLLDLPQRAGDKQPGTDTNILHLNNYSLWWITQQQFVLFRFYQKF